MSCDGSCCAVFYFPSSPDEIRQKLDAGINYNDGDGEYLADMLIPLTLEEAQERAEKFGIRPPSYETHGRLGWNENTPLYTCKHWDEETRLCSAYEDRPKMCRDFPYGQICEHCNWTNCDRATPIDKVLVAY